MKAILNIILISSFLTLSAPAQERSKKQGQVFLGIKTGLKNLFKTTTIDPISRLLSRKKHYLPTTMCSSDPLKHKMLTQHTEEATSLLSFISSECKPWSLNDKCSCSIRCPDDYNIIKYAPFNESLNVTEENSFPFRNSSSDFADSKFKNTYGICWGHAIGTQRFNRLAIFQEDEPLTNRRGKVLEKNSKKWVREIKKKINRVFRNHLEIFPGFSNLRELASTPPFDVYIKNKVAKKWANEAMSFQGLGMVLNSQVDKLKKVDRVLVRLMDRINQGISPQIIFTAKGYKGMTHAVLVSDYKVKEDSVVLCLRDNNYSIKNNKNCANKMTFIKRDGKYSINYGPWGAIGGVRFGHNEDKDLIKQIKNVRRLCVENLCQE
jgi:hypothetical protein